MIQSGLIAFDVICKINNIPVDLRAIVRENGITNEEISVEELLLIAKHAEFKAKLKNIDLSDAKKYPFPAIFILKNKTYGVILKPDFENEKALVFIPEEQKAREVTFEELSEIGSGEYIFLSHKLINEQIKFGFKWFFIEIMK